MDKEKAFLWIKKAVSMAVFFLFYFIAIRPFRGFFSETFIQPLFDGADLNPAIQAITVEARSIYILLESSEKLFTYTPQFGFFFLFGMLGLLWLNPAKKVYAALTVALLSIELMVWVFLMIGLYVNTAGFMAADFLTLYLSPLICIGFIVGVYMVQKKGLTLKG